MSEKEMRLKEITTPVPEDVLSAARWFQVEFKAFLINNWPDGLPPSQAVVKVSIERDGVAD